MQGPIRILSTAVAGFVTAVVVSAPFGLSVISFSTTAPFVDSSLLRLIFSTASTYSYVSVNAYNLWALFPVDGQSMATSRGWQYDAPVPDASSWAAIGPLPAAVVGGALLALLLFVVVPVLVARRPDRLTILVGVSVLALAFFAVPTRVHERYLFPLFAIAAIPFAFSWRWRIFYIVASIATFLNMYAVLTTIYPDNPSISDWLGIGDAITSQAGVTLIAVLHTAAFLWAFAQLRPGAQRTFEAELEHGREPDAWDEPPALEPVPAGVMAFDADGPPVGAPTMALASATGAYGAAVAETYAASDGGRAVPARRLVPAWFDRPGWTDVGPIAWVRGRINETPIRPDRSRLLGSEGRGHLDRLDLWILIVLFVSAMCLRTFRLAEPARMHFDEVYHARTAAEFLQDWRYGISHYIYEWTHPHLAKYAMAGGIVLFAGHDTAATSELGTPVRDAAIEPRRPDPDSATARDGDRVWVVTGSALSGYDLETRKLVATWPIEGASAITYDADGIPAVRRHGRRRDPGARHDAARRRSRRRPERPPVPARVGRDARRVDLPPGDVRRRPEPRRAAPRRHDRRRHDRDRRPRHGRGHGQRRDRRRRRHDRLGQRRRGHRDAGGHRGPGGRRRQAGRDPRRGRRLPTSRCCPRPTRTG